MFVVEPLADARYRRLHERLRRLEVWLELALVPSEEECEEDRDLLSCPEDLKRLRGRCEAVRGELGEALPWQRGGHLRVEPRAFQVLDLASLLLKHSRQDRWWPSTPVTSTT